MLPLMSTFSQAGALLRRHPALLVPALFGALAARLALGGAGNMPGMLAFGLLNIALTAGLIAMIRALHAGEQGLWDAFLVGIGRHYGSLLAGTLMMAALALATLLPVLSALEAIAGLPDAQLLQKAIRAGSALPAAQLHIVERWGLGIAGWGAVWGLFAFFLVVWKQAVVVEALPWSKAWRASAGFVRGHWASLLAIVVLEGLSLGLGLLLTTLQADSLAALGSLVLLVANVYFTIALTVAFMGAPGKGKVLDEVA